MKAHIFSYSLHYSQPSCIDSKWLSWVWAPDRSDCYVYIWTSLSLYSAVNVIKVMPGIAAPGNIPLIRVTSSVAPPVTSSHPVQRRVVTSWSRHIIAKISIIDYPHTLYCQASQVCCEWILVIQGQISWLSWYLFIFSELIISFIFDNNGFIISHPSAPPFIAISSLYSPCVQCPACKVRHRTLVGWNQDE